MEGLVDQTPMLDVLRGREVFERHPFVLVDIGSAGGIDPAWRAFGRTLVAHGFDPDPGACAEAQDREVFPNVHYHARFVGLPESHPFVRKRATDAEQWPSTNIWGRVTAARLAGAQETPESEQRRAPVVSTPVSVDEIVRSTRLPTVDFLKVDVDGPDLEVLESARTVLARDHVLGVGLEVNWFGSSNPTEHTFHNTDRFLREHDFTLFGLTQRPYSRVDLPAPFQYDTYAQTTFGQPYQGDAIYLRDLAAPWLDELAAGYGDEKLVKLACLYELIGLPDCAAEVLNRFASRLEAFGDREALLDALTPPLLGRRLTYREYVETFAREPSRFLPSAAAAAERASERPVLWTPELEAAKREEWLRELVATRGSLARRAYRRLRRGLRR